MTKETVSIVQFPRKLGVPNASPFCVKLELWLKLADIPHAIEEQFDPSKGPKKKIPYAIIDGEKVGDSTLIIEHLARKFEFDIDAGLGEHERAMTRAIIAMCEERLYWCGVHDRWLGAGWPGVSEAFFGGMPAPIRMIAKKMARRAVRKQLWEQGTGRHTPEEVFAMATSDVSALAEIIGDGPYVFGDTLRLVDCVVYGMVVNLTHVQLDTPLTRAAREHANLVDYAERISREYFPDRVAAL